MIAFDYICLITRFLEMEYKIFIIEDNPDILKGLANLVNQYGYTAIEVTDFKTIEKQVEEAQPHLIFLDINLPYYDGFFWCAKIRKITLCPIVMISARDGALDQVMAMDNGADDYITKPFNNEVVIAKIKSHLRRSYGDYVPEKNELQVEGLKLQLDRLLLIYGDKEVILSAKEMILMQTLMQQHTKVVKREILLEKVWDDQNFVEENTLNVNINRLRNRLKDLGLIEVLETIRGLGYSLNLTKKQPN